MPDEICCRMSAIDVSPEMLALVGRGSIGCHAWPAEAVALEVDFGDLRRPASFTFHAQPEAGRLENSEAPSRLLLIVARPACERVLGRALDFADGSTRQLPSGIRTIALAIRDCRLAEAAAAPYRLAKCIELLCEILNAHNEGALAEVGGLVSLSLGDTQRVLAARKLIDDNWNEKLRLDQIARLCGLNRSKLARGFRELYGCTVTEALAERRLGEARRQLIATDLPVSLIGYRTGYQNNASFSRAFGRRFGLSPSDFRACGVAA
jgi:AraC family transcriptional activator of pyochelin receptor